MEEEKIVNLGGVNRPIPSPGILQNPGNQVPGNSPSPRDMFLGIMKQNQSTSLPNIPVSSFYTGNRFEQTRPFSDYEEMAAQQQSGFEQFRNGIGKMVGLAGTSFISGTAGLLYGIGSAASTLKFSNLYNNPVTQMMDQAQSGMEDYLPNYYKKSEQDAEWWSPDNWYTANFWGDKVFKNIGYGIGSIAGGAAWTKVFKLIGQTNSLVRAGKGLEVSANIEKAMGIVPKTQKLSAIESTLANLSQGARDIIKNNGDRFLTSAMGTFGEASIEALQKMNEFRNSAIEEYKNEFGYAPQGEDLNEINEFAEKAGNYVWGMNTVLLTGSNYFQLPKILGSSRKVEKAFINKLTQEGLGKEFIEKTAKTRFGKLLDTTTGLSRFLISPVEAAEEGLQFSVATGVDDYFDRAYKNKEELGSFLETVYGAMGNVFGEGIEKTLTTKEGIESLIIGSLAGGIQQAPMSIYTEGLTGRGGQRKRNTDIALKQLNETNIQAALKDQADFMAIGVGSQAMRQQAIENNDVLSEKDYEKDFTLSYLMPRAKYGKMDSVYNELDYYKQQALAGGFEELQSAGIAFDGETKEQFVQRIGNLENTAKSLNKHYDNINLNYAGVLLTDKDGNVVNDKKGNPLRKYAPVVVDKLVYAASKIDDYSARIPGVNAELAAAGIPTVNILQNILENNKPNKESVKEALDQINAMDVTNDTKDDLKRSLSDLIELSLRRKLFINQYNGIKEKPLNYTYFSASEKVREMGSVELTQKEGKKNVTKSFEVGKEYSLDEPIRLENGKLVLAPKLTILSQTLGGEFEVRLPDGREVFLSPLEFKAYGLTEEDNASPELEKALDQAIDEVLSLPEYKDIPKIPGMSKYQFVNSIGDEKLLKDILKRFNDIAKVVIEEKKDVKRAEEEIKKNKKEIIKQIDDVIPGEEVETFPPTLEELEKKASDDTGELGYLPSADKFFIRSTTASEDVTYEGYDPNPDPHIVRSRIFLNNVRKFSNNDNILAIPFTVKQAESIPGLDKLIRLSYGISEEEYNSEGFDKKAFDAKIKDVATGFVGMLFVEQDPVTKEMFYIDQDGNRINKLGEEIDLTKVIFQTMPTTEVKYSDGSDRYRGPEKPQFLANAVAWGAARKKMFDDSSVSAYKFEVSRGVPVVEPNVEGRMNEFAVGGGHLATDDEIYSMKGLIEVVTKGFVAFQGQSIKMRKGTTVLKNKDVLVYLNNAKFGRKKAQSIYRVMKALVDEMVQSGKAGKAINLNKQYIAFLKSVMFYKAGETQSKGRFFIDLDNMNFIIGNTSYPIRDFATYEKAIIDELTDTYHSISKETLTKFFEEPFYEFYYENGALKEREWLNYQTYLLSGKDRSVDDIPLITTVAKPSEGNPNSFLSKYAVLADFNLGAQRVKSSDKKQKEPKLPKDKKRREEEVVKKPEGYNYEGKLNTYPASFGNVKFTATKDADNNVNVNVNFDENVPTFQNFKDDELAKAKERVVSAQMIEEDETSKNTIVAAYTTLVLDTLLSKEEKEKAKAPAAPAAPASDIETRKAAISEGINKSGNDKIEFTEEQLIKAVDGIKPDGKISTTALQRIFKIGNIDKAARIAKKIDAELAALEGTSSSDLENKIQSLSNSVYSDSNNLGLFLDVLLDTTKDYKAGADINQEGFVVNFSGVESKDDINLTINNLSKEGDNYRIIGKGGKGSKAPSYNFLVSPSGEVLSITSKEGKTFSGETYTNVSPTEKLRNSIQSTSNKDLMTRLAALTDVTFVEEPVEEKVEPVEKPTPPSGKTFKKKDDPLFREVGELDVERITPEDIEEFKKWHAEKVPFIPYEILEQIYKSVDSVRAWGVFEEGVAKFYKGAQRGTEYHEIFEAIWASFLTPAERESILKQERNKGGYFVDRASRKEILYLDATEKQIKERIADDFADFRVGKLPARNLSERIRRFFKAIVDFFKSFIQKPSLKEELFKAIDSGKFKESRIPEQVKVLAPEYRAIPGIDETAANLIVEDMISETARFLFGEDKSLLYNTKELTGSQVYNNLLDIYSEPDNNRLEVIGEEAFDDLYERMRGFFYSLGVTIPVDEAIEINEGDVTNRNYAPEPFETDWKKNARFAIKFAIATLIKRKDQGQADVSTIELKGNTLQGYQLTPFGRTFSDLLKTLSNSSIEQFAQKIIKKSASNPTYKGLMNRLGGDATNGYFPFEKFKTDDWRFYIQFFQTFAKQKPEIIIQYMDGGLVYSAEADNFSSTNILVKDWIESMKQLAKDKSSIIKYNRVNKTYKIDTSSKDYPDSLPKNAVEQIEYLEKLGIDFPIEIYRLLKDTPQPGQNASDKDQFIDAVSTIYEYLQKTEELGSLSTSVLDVNSSYMTLARLYSKVTSIEESNVLTNVKGKMMQKYTENNYTSVFENEFNSSKDLAELMSKFPQLNDTYSKNSLVLKQGGKFFNPSGKKTKDLKVKVIQGVIDLQEGKGSEISELSIGQRFSLEINQNLKGNYYIFVPADSSTEWMLNVGNEISFEDSSSDRGWNKTYSIFKGYLEDEINLALDYVNRKELKNTRPDAKKLRMFADILPESVVNKVHEMIEENSSTEDILNYVMDKKDANDNSVFELSIFYMINSDVDTTLETLINNGELVSIPTEEGAEPSYKWSSLEISDESKIKQNFYDKNNLSETQVREILTFANINYAIANIEMHKLLFGDPYQFKSSEDEVKRIKSFLSPRRTTFDSVELNNKLNKVGNTVNDVVIPVGDLFNYQFKDHIDTVSLADVEIFSKAYPGVKITETDGFSIIIDGAFREVKIKNAEWSDQAEAWYQWQTAYARRELSNKGLYSYPKGSNALQNADERTLKNPEPDYKLEVLKPIVSGVKYNSNTIELVLDKMSQMPIFYKAVKGTAMEELYLQMLQNKIGYVAYNSARKEGVRDLHELYDVEKSFNKAGFTPLTIEKISWKSYGIQVSNLYQDDKHQTRGSQITKIVSMDMFANGKEVMKGAKDLYDRNVDMLDKLHENAYNTLLEKLGIVDTGIDFVAPDMVSVAELLTSEILKRDPSENLKDSLELVDGQFKLRLEASTDYRKIKEIVYSLVHKSIVSPSMNGRPHVQTPVTLWENQKEGRGLIRKVGEKWVNVTRQEYDNLSDAEKEGVKLSSNKLKFYTEDQPYIEVMIPYFFKEKMVGANKKFKNDQELLKYLNDTEEGRSILTGVGFRIPTQAMSSSEVFKVVGFLHPSMGYTVVVPSEITHKAGSDFDIDKLNMYLKSIYIDEQGNPRLITYKGSEEATKEFYSKLYDNSVKAKLDKLMRSEKFKKNTLELFSYSLISQDAETRPIVEYAAEMPSELIEFLMDNEDVISEIEEQAFELEMNQYDYYKQQVDRSEKLKGKLSDDQLQKYLKDEYVKRMYKKSLENEYYDTMVKMIQLPDNYKRLLFPVGKANLDNVAKDIRNLMGDNTDLVKNKLINRNYLTKIRQAFVMGKKWVGIAAVNITGHSLAQKANLFLDTRRLKNVDAYSRSFLGNLSTFLPHNTIMVDGKEMISLAGRATADGKNEFISDRLSGYASGFVDVSKDPYIMDIIRSNSVVGTAMFLERIGVGEATPYFLNQPIIIDYLTYLNSIQAKGLFSKKNLEAVLNRFITSDEALAFAKENAKNKTIDTSINHLRENISKFKTNKGVMSVEFNAEQRVIFMEFLKLAKMGQEVFTFTQGYNYDTTRFRNSDSFERKVVRTVKARTNNIINSIDSVFENSFIGNQKDFVDRSMNAMGAIFKLEHPKFRYVKDEVMKNYREDDYLSQDDYDTIAEKVGASYFDFIVQTNSDIQAELQELTTGNDSVASQLPNIKLKHPNIKLLSELTTESSFRPGGAETIRLKVKPDLSTEVNSYIGMMRELKQLEPEFYNRLVKLAIIQGSYPSYVTILQIVPQEDYAAIVNPIIEKLAPSNALDVFYQEALFQRQNWKDDVAVPTVKKYNYKQKVDIYSDDVTYSTEMFGAIPGEPISRRQILLLNPNYNLSDEVVKIPRVVKASIRKNKNTPEGKVTFQETVMIDISKNRPVSTADIAKSRAKGMFTYDVYYGYKKVRYSDGSPLIDQDGNHVYKRINLYGDGAFASEYRTDREASIFNNGTAPATYEFTKKTTLERPDGTRELIKTVEVVQELDDAQVIAAYGMEMAEEEQVIYSMLGSKTKSENVVIKPWNELKNATRVITPEAIVSTRVRDNDTAHFGNPFANDRKILSKNPILIPTKSTKESVQRYIKWILTGDIGNAINITETPEEFEKRTGRRILIWERSKIELLSMDLDERREWILEELQSGKHKGKSILYYAELGQPSHATALDYLINEYDWSEQIVPTEVVEEAPTKNVQGFEGYKGGFENTGKGTSQGDGKDKAMREVADSGFIGELDTTTGKESSTLTSFNLMSSGATVALTDLNKAVKQFPVIALKPTGNTIMLARNKELINNPLSQKTKDQILSAKVMGKKFVVGDMPGVDSQFIDYLQEIGAKFTVYHTGNNSRIEIRNVDQKAKQPSRKKTKQTNQLSLFGDETGAAPRLIKIDQYQITVQPDGKMLFANGTEVTDQTIKNKVDIQIAIQDKTLKISTYNKNKYFVLSDDRILGSGKTNLGKETVTDPDIRKKIIMTAVLYKKTC